MGISLYNLTPSSTYQSLLKIGNNSALSATLNSISDGLGNDTTLNKLCVYTTAWEIVTSI